MINAPVTTEEKTEIATVYVKKMRKLMAIRLGLIAFFSLIFFNMKTLSRMGLTELALGAFMVCAVVISGLSIYSHANLYCPFCGERFGYWTSKTEILPDECPKCSERIKY